jgi:DNA repair exonuclease SbcCD nuclease subunit
LLVADTHLGFDLPLRPRIERRRRGPDFFANFHRALEPARRGEVDLVVHGGDLLFRSRVRRELVYRAFEPLIEVAGGGVPVVVVPGIHERSAIPYPLLAAHRGVHILDRPRTIRLEAGGCAVAVAGFPFQREEARARFPGLVAETGWRRVSPLPPAGPPAGEASAPTAAGPAGRKDPVRPCANAVVRPAEVRLLCLHQTFEGARVGASGYTFRHGADVLRGRDIPPGFAAVLAGHIHRRQVLTDDLEGRPLAAPVLYPGSIERTSFAERKEPKGYMTLVLSPDSDGGHLEGWAFHELPARPMVDLEIDGAGVDRRHLTERLRRSLGALDPDAVVRLTVRGQPGSPAARTLDAAGLRAVAPATMTVTLRPASVGRRQSDRRH